MKILEIFNAVKAAKNQRDAARYAKNEAAYSDANNGMPPTRDSKGRLHSPCDGYCPAWAETSDLYRKGEYLPEPEVEFGEQDYKPGFKYPSYRVTLLASDAHLLANSEQYFCEIEMGRKSWIDGDFEFCNVFIRGGNFAKQLSDAIAQKYTLPESKKGDAPVGKSVVTGQIVKIKPVETMYGRQYKMMVKLDNGATVWGTLPAFLSESNEGDTVTFKATFEASDKPSHAFFKRPTQP